MRSPDSIQVLLRVRSQKEGIEERKLTAIIRKLECAQAELAGLSAELNRITTTRLSGIQCALPNTHHREVEAQLRALWQRCADHAAEIESLRVAQTRQMSTYLSAHREREVTESLNKQRSDALEAERALREQKLNDDLFLARRVSEWDM